MMIGFPCTSFTFCCALLSVIVLVETFLLVLFFFLEVPLFLALSLTSAAISSRTPLTVGLKPVENGLTKKNPSFLIVPWYLPNSVRTRASFGFTILSPPRHIASTTMRITPTATDINAAPPDSASAGPAMHSATPAMMPIMQINSIAMPGIGRSSRSSIFVLIAVFLLSIFILLYQSVYFRRFKL